jgi:DNA-directed RNA polymerase specialized sigma24 family protein
MDPLATIGNETRLHGLVAALRRGDPQARDALIDHAAARLLLLTRRMFRGRPGLQRWEQTDDVFQNAMLRLHKAMESREVESVRHFFNLAAVQIRRELIDLGRKHFGPHGLGRNHHTDRQPADDRGGTLHTLEAERSGSQPVGEAATCEKLGDDEALVVVDAHVVDRGDGRMRSGKSSISSTTRAFRRSRPRRSSPARSGRFAAGGTTPSSGSMGA